MFVKYKVRYPEGIKKIKILDFRKYVGIGRPRKNDYSLLTHKELEGYLDIVTDIRLAEIFNNERKRFEVKQILQLK